MERGIDSWAACHFRRELNEAVIQFKKDHPGLLEAMTAERKQKERDNHGTWNESQI